MNFASDNTAGVAPEIMQALLKDAVAGSQSAYGADDVTARLEARLSEVFETNLRVFPVATGTAANSIALATITPPWGSVLCHEFSHIMNDECGAPEFFSGGARLHGMQSEDAKITPDMLLHTLERAGGHGIHAVKPASLSLTNATELGTSYTPTEVKALTDIAHAHGLKCHMDGTRFANVVAHQGCSPADMSWRAGIDILCLGATKNGAYAAEVIVVFDTDLANEVEIRRKRGGHLFSKMRFISTQLEAWLKDDLWMNLAKHSNQMASYLADGLNKIDDVKILHSIGANMMFARMKRSKHNAAQLGGAYYYLEPAWQKEDGNSEYVECRFVCSFETTKDEIDHFLEVLKIDK